MNKAALKALKIGAIATALLIVTGCSDLALFNPKGEIAEYEKWLLIISAALMLIVIIPCIIMAVIFPWWFRESNKKATYKPEWQESKILERFMWGVPIAIIALLTFITVQSTIDLNPKKRIESEKEDLVIEVVSMDWQWLFIYPEEGIATINTLYLPVDRPLKFRLTSQTVMNAFFIPQIGTQLDVMSGMENVLYLIVNEEGTYQGASYGYSGAGYSDMKFRVTALSDEDFAKWVKEQQSHNNNPLDWAKYQEFVREEPINAPEQYFHPIEKGLYLRVISQFLDLEEVEEHMREHIHEVNVLKPKIEALLNRPASPALTHISHQQ